MINSIYNPKIKRVRALQSQSRARRRESAFVVEGVRLVEEALAAAWPVQIVLCTADLDARAQAVVDGLAAAGAPVEQVTPQVMRAASDTETPQGVLAVLSQRQPPEYVILDFVLIPDGVRDPGNLGTMMRTAAAAGAQAVLIPPGNVDPFAPKVVRAGMGAHFHLPLYPLGWEEIHDQTQTLNLYLAEAGGGLPYTQADYRSPFALIIGGEAGGAGPEAHGLDPILVHIPMPGESESMNAAVAAGIILFEAARQRGSG